MSGPHTPGPWAVHPLACKFGGHVVPADHVARPIGCSTDTKADRDEYALQLCIVNKDKHGRNNVTADARLIAAAPDLLEALQALFGADMEHVLMGDGKDDQIEAIAKAHAAIAKATGATA